LNGQAKLTDAQATQIKILYTNKVYSQGMLAKQFNIRQSQVSRIVNGVRRGGVS
jgi:DNA-binding MarR family transcriptional regulator